MADGLMNPRGMAFDSEGNLYVVENGSAGDIMIEAGTRARADDDRTWRPGNGRSRRKGTVR